MVRDGKEDYLLAVGTLQGDTFPQATLQSTSSKGYTAKYAFNPKGY